MTNLISSIATSTPTDALASAAQSLLSYIGLVMLSVFLLGAMMIQSDDRADAADAGNAEACEGHAC